jgi:uncharacterized protein YegP (UPF0339 family)
VAGKGEIYKRNDVKWAFRVKASNGETVATDGGQGYSAKSSARSTLEKLLRGDYDGPIEKSASSSPRPPRKAATPRCRASPLRWRSPR